MKRYFKILAVFLGFVLFVGLITTIKNVDFSQITISRQKAQPSPTAPASTATPVPLPPENAIEVTAFTPGGTVIADIVILDAPGYIVVHEDEDGELGKIIGESALLSEGETKNVVIELSRESKEGEVFYAVLYADDEDGEFEEDQDVPVEDEKGNVVLAKFTVGAPQVTI